MSWRPSSEAFRYDPDKRLDRFRERGGHLTNSSGTFIGELYLQVEQQAEVVSGALWWRRWGPWFDTLRWFTTRVDGGPDEQGTGMFDDGESLLHFLNNDQWPTFDEEGVLTISWLDDAASEDMRARMGSPPQPDLHSPAQNVRFFRHKSSGMFRYPLPEGTEQ